jgi:hypothetical protein
VIWFEHVVDPHSVDEVMCVVRASVLAEEEYTTVYRTGYLYASIVTSVRSQCSHVNIDVDCQQITSRGSFFVTVTIDTPRKYQRSKAMLKVEKITDDRASDD